MKELSELLEQRREALEFEMTEKHWNKLKGGEICAGSRCVIVWKEWGDDYVDEGYLFELPIGNESDEADIFVHIPEPQNPDGIDTPPAVFLHLQDLMRNVLVESITLSE